MLKKILPYIIALFCGSVIGGYAGLLFSPILNTALSGPSVGPTIAGQPVPEDEFEIDFTKRYDLYLGIKGEPQVLKNCLIRGFTKEYKPEGSYKSGYGYFERWLVVETANSRLLYVPARSIDLIEEASDVSEQ